jgi:hypothetical protein
MLAALAIGVALGGWLIPLGLDATRVLDQPYTLLEAHPAGLLLGLAVVRGSAHLSELDDDDSGGHKAFALLERLGEEPATNRDLLELLAQRPTP